MTPLRILHVLRSPRAEGTVKLALDWLDVSEFGQDVLVLHPDPDELTAPLRRRARWMGFGPGLHAGPGKFPAIMAEVWRVCRLQQPDMVICWPNGFAPWVLAGAWLAGVPRLITHAGNPPTETAWGSVQTVISTFVTWVARGRMVCCSHFVATQFARSPGAFASVLAVAYNCAPVSAIRAAATQARGARSDFRPRLIMVATLEPHKDHETLLRAMPEILRRMPDLQLWLAGEGSLRTKLEATIAALGIQKSVTLLGSRPDVPALLGVCDAFVFSTTPSEGLGTVLIEALAAGLPVIASDVPACRELLQGGRWGKLVPARDPAVWVGAVVETLARRSDAPAAACDEYLAAFSPRAMIAAYARVHDAG